MTVSGALVAEKPVVGTKKTTKKTTQSPKTVQKPSTTISTGKKGGRLPGTEAWVRDGISKEKLNNKHHNSGVSFAIVPDDLLTSHRKVFLFVGDLIFTLLDTGLLSATAASGIRDAIAKTLKAEDIAIAIRDNNEKAHRNAKSLAKHLEITYDLPEGEEDYSGEPDDSPD